MFSIELESIRIKARFYFLRFPDRSLSVFTVTGDDNQGTVLEVCL